MVFWDCIRFTVSDSITISDGKSCVKMKLTRGNNNKHLYAEVNAILIKFQNA